MYIDSIEINNLRCFKNTSIRFRHPGLKKYPHKKNKENIIYPPDNVNLLLGNNGAGKTTLLKAIALASLSPIIEKAGYVPYHLLRHDTKHASVEAKIYLHDQDASQINSKESPLRSTRILVKKIKTYEELEADNRESELWDNIYDDESPAFFIVGYGATRRVETSDVNTTSLRKARRIRYQRVAGLFEDHIALTPLASWLPKVKRDKPGRYKEIIVFFDQLLPENIRFDGKIIENEVYFRQQENYIPFAALSDGYRAYIGWISDLFYNMCLSCSASSSLAEMRGIVLVDEIDLHLHPEWQRNVISMISKTLPNLQFILTSHSPLVAGTLGHENIFVLELDEINSSKVRQIQEKIFGQSADQILLSSYFNLKTTRAQDFEIKLRQISKRAQKGDVEAAVDFLNMLAGKVEAEV